MKKTAVYLVFVSSVLLFATYVAQAAEQKIVFNTESIEYKSGTGPMRCQEICDKKSGTDLTALLSDGWKIVSSTAKKVIGEQYRYVPCPTCSPHGCTCIGTEYLLQRDIIPPRVDTSSSELYILKNEKDLLKQEVIQLKREIETLKNQIKPKQVTD
ncbi:MAG: hypothetical protein EG822_02040 [Deltaproteobacteria bacterium]|nr:hypothetical protein [Deltaproteobacteria bacterium]TLN00448.1 MAG: hypothetical protein FDZ73_19440 [bacterium]